ncbi:hypothetical protein Taro_036316 [Colocasia esculenta]|uniref:Leucine-rich repeat-containing N-terminal plant-type domain-containing protein n=1 Tax=Colocasia esculenta TaxID=4460 RepID=A0A843WG09_COLES|nr:hypothetical protein [Colocasia esculenta]
MMRASRGSVPCISQSLNAASINFSRKASGDNFPSVPAGKRVDPADVTPSALANFYEAAERFVEREREWRGRFPVATIIYTLVCCAPKAKVKAIFWGGTEKGLAMAFTKILVLLHLLVRLTVIFVIPVCWGYTYEQDVYAINNLYASLGSPLLPGWIPNGGDPCVELWQGVECVGPNITAMYGIFFSNGFKLMCFTSFPIFNFFYWGAIFDRILNGANLGGELGDKLENFSSIITIDLSNNHIGGSIPENLPITMQRFFLSDNAFTGSIPDSLSQLTSLTAMSLNNNMLIGALPDAFQSLTGLINLHIQKNQLSGTLDVLQDLPLKDLNVENNLFSGPVPTKLYSIPNFRSDGNPFNTTISPASPSPSPPSGTPDSSAAPSNPANGPSAQDDRPPTRRTKWSTQRIVGCAFAAAIAVIILVLAVMLVANYCLSKQRERKSNHEITPKSREFGTYARPRVEPRHTDYPTLPSNHLPTHEIKNVPKEAASKQQEELDIDKMSIVLAPPPVEKIVVDPIAPVEKTRTPSPERLQSPPSAVNLNPATSVLSFSVGTLQQYTDSFSEENVIRDTRLGRVYQGRLSDGKVIIATLKKCLSTTTSLEHDWLIFFLLFKK